MKIVHIMNYYMPKMAYQENHLPQNQKKIGNSVEIITSDRYFPFSNYEDLYKKFLGARVHKNGIIEDNGVKIYKLKPLYENVNHALIFFKKKEVYKILDNIKPNIIHVHSPKNLNLIYINKWCKDNSCKLFIDCHDDYGNTTFKKKGIKKLIMNTFNILYKDIVKNTKCFLPITNESYKVLKNEYKIEKNKIAISGLGVDINNCRYNDKFRKELRNMFDFKNDDIVFITTGRITIKQNSILIINSFIELNKKYKNIKLFLQGNIESDLKKFVDGKNIIDNSFIESNQLYKYFSMADVAIWSNPTNSIQDGMSCSKPIIIPNKENIKYLVSANNGFTYSNQQELTKYMEYFVINKLKISELGNKSREFAKEKLSWEIIAKNTLEIYCKY